MIHTTTATAASTATTMLISTHLRIFSPFDGAPGARGSLVGRLEREAEDENGAGIDSNYGEIG